MTRIVTSVPRPKRTTRKRAKGGAIAVPVIVAAKRSRHPQGKQAAAEVASSLNQNDEAAQPSTALDAARDPTPANDDQKPAIVTSISRKRARQRRAGYTAAEPDEDLKPDQQTPAATSSSEALMQAMARMIRPPE
jgi:hypothetical protein